MKDVFILILALEFFLSIILSGCTGSKHEPSPDVGSNFEQSGKEEAREMTASLIIKNSENSENASSQKQQEVKIHVNQVGYKTRDKKLIVISGKGGKFEIVDEKSGEVVFSGETTGPEVDISSGDTVFFGDFSSLETPGIYYVSMPGFGKSFSFKVDGRVYKDVKNSLLKALYYQRCGVALEEKYAGQWKHEACHLDDAIVYKDQEKRLETKGGWHDAGDYGRYTSPAAKAVADLLLAYEMFPDAWKEQINIPESGNGIPDILNEAKYELEWLLKMQDAKTGGVYHKVSTLNFPGFIMPEKDKGTLYLADISPTGTADFAAIMAMASRTYEKFDKAFSERMLKAAEKAWVWLENNPDAPGFKNPPGYNTGEYGDNNSADEKFWAAVELYKSTGKTIYHEFVKSTYQDNFTKNGLGWADMGGYGTISYLFMDKSMTDEDVYGYLKDIFMNRADKLVANIGADGYRVAIASGEYIWGSNMGVANNAMHLLIANMISPRAEYVQYAEDQLHYLLGRNSLDQSYVTGFGSRPVMNPHHRPSGSDGIGDPVPGMLSGGPNKGLNDPTAKEMIKPETPPAKCFVDEEGSWSTNEITIYWNSPAIFLAGYFDRDDVN